MTDLPFVRLRPDREGAIRRGHPWLLSGSVAEVSGRPEPGDTVEVQAASGARLGIGDFDPASQIRVRLSSIGDAPHDPAESWLEERLEAALARRAGHPALARTNALRWAHAEADGLPGLIVDRYSDWAVIKAGTPAMERRVERVADWLRERAGVRGSWVRGSWTPVDGASRGAGRCVRGEVPEEPIEIDERGRRYSVDLRHGQKTGFYLDQRDARDRFETGASGLRVLDLCCYSGGFAIAAERGGASRVVALDSSKRALDLLRRSASEVEAIKEDVGRFLRRDTRRWDRIALDPPPLARRKRDVPAALRAYKDLNLWALRRAAAGAELFTFSCSHHLTAEHLDRCIASAALDAQVRVQVLGRLGAAPDHPVDTRHPQGEYLHGLWLRVVDPAP